MKLTLDNLRARITEINPTERAWLASFLAFEDATSRFRGGDGTINLYDVLRNTFPAGLLQLVEAQAIEDGVAIEVTDQRHRPVQPLDNPDLGWLRDYQVEAVQRVLARERGILWVPTGGGKTEVMAGLVRSIPARWLFLVHRAHLMQQAAERYELRTGLKAGRIGEGVWEPKPFFTVATFQTIHARLGEQATQRLLDEAQGVIVDEAHVLPAGTFWTVAQRMKNAYWRVGLSATPLARGDRRSVLTIAALGPVIYRLKPEVLIERGVLARPTIAMLPVKHEAAEEGEGESWSELYTRCVTENAMRNNLIVDTVRRAAKPCMVFVTELDHGKRLCKLLDQAKITNEFVSGVANTDRRKASIKRLERGDTEVIVATAVFNEGVDIPCLRSVVIGAGGRCLGPDTPVLRYDGSVVAAKDVRTGDVLMGPDSQPRRVLGTTTGVSPMYRVTPNRGPAWTCNDKHILTVGRRANGKDEVLDLPIEDLLKRRDAKYLTLFSVGVDFPTQPPVPVDPYFVGMWYGDGTKSLRMVEVTKPDPEVRATMEEVATRYGLKVTTVGACTMRITGPHGGHARNPLLDALREVVGDGAALPSAYLTASREERAQFLAGYLDTDGAVKRNGYEIVQKPRAYAEGICFLANSLGLRATMAERPTKWGVCWRVTITGDCSFLPLRIARKRVGPRTERARHNHTGFRIEAIGEGAYAGFQVDGDGRFLLGDFTVTHNSTIAALQRLGRALRVTVDKTHCQAWDFFDKGNRILEKHSTARQRAYLKEGFEVHVQDLPLASTLLATQTAAIAQSAASAQEED